jgi:hypothetical protein
LGKEGVNRQAKAAVSRAIEKRQPAIEPARQEQRTHRQERPPKALKVRR